MPFVFGIFFPSIKGWGWRDMGRSCGMRTRGAGIEEGGFEEIGAGVLTRDEKSK
jgi:hypothetical protein